MSIGLEELGVVHFLSWNITDEFLKFFLCCIFIRTRFSKMKTNFERFYEIFPIRMFEFAKFNEKNWLLHTCIFHFCQHFPLEYTKTFEKIG